MTLAEAHAFQVRTSSLSGSLDPSRAVRPRVLNDLEPIRTMVNETQIETLAGGAPGSGERAARVVSGRGGRSAARWER